MKTRDLSQLGKVSEVIFINDRLLFPISWLHKQEYCEYQIYLENIKGIIAAPTKAMVEGKDEHEQLYNEFKKVAVPTTFEEMLLESKKIEVISRELRVRDLSHGNYGRIDEILMTPEEFIVIDDKPGTKTFLSNIHQIFGYCLAFKERVQSELDRPLVAALRERGTDNIYWKAPFDTSAEDEVTGIIDHIHALIAGKEEFTSSDNPNKCRACRFRVKCDRVMK